ncbi:MAG TPA: VWA domain-containing protein [Kofleriaceae bacterium]
MATLALMFSCGPTRHTPGGDDDNNGADGGNNQGSQMMGSSCVTSTETAMSTPLDIYIMLDQSGSMDMDSKWTDVSSALETFVQQPNLNGISVGIQYFGQSTGNECDVTNYSTPEVEIAPLPGVASSIVSSVTSHNSDVTEELDDTPTWQALSGAVAHAKTWATAHPSDTVAVVIATDGEPEASCGSDTNISSSVTVAQNAYAGTPKIPTFVIGVDDGTNLTNLNDLAAGGGTGSAFIVNAGGSAQQQFLNALNAIRGTAIGCTYQIPVPSMGMINYNQVNIIYTPGGGGSPVTIPQVASMSACPSTGNAWYYDNPTAPTEIILCSATCGTIEADSTGSLGIALGCSTVIE